MTLPVPCGVGEWSQNGVCVLRARVGLGLSHHLECPSGVGSSGRQGSLTGLSGILKGAISRSPTTPRPPLLSPTPRTRDLAWFARIHVEGRPLGSPASSSCIFPQSQRAHFCSYSSPRGTVYVFPWICLLHLFRNVPLSVLPESSQLQSYLSSCSVLSEGRLT